MLGTRRLNFQRHPPTLAAGKASAGDQSYDENAASYCHPVSNHRTAARCRDDTEWREYALYRRNLLKPW